MTEPVAVRTAIQTLYFDVKFLLNVNFILKQLLSLSCPCSKKLPSFHQLNASGQKLYQGRRKVQHLASLLGSIKATKSLRPRQVINNVSPNEKLISREL